MAALLWVHALAFENNSHDEMETSPATPLLVDPIISNYISEENGSLTVRVSDLQLKRLTSYVDHSK
jgi:hypothetical protein